MIDARITTEHRRLAILRHLAAASTYSANASILTAVCNGVGVASTTDQVISALAWLDEQDMVTLMDNAEFTLATATARGLEVASGAAQVPGVARPRPKA
ncbi:MAG: VpaChn25_0724 family phage protein [Shimia sp.]